jgi:hypothetical protein
MAPAMTLGLALIAGVPPVAGAAAAGPSSGSTCQLNSVGNRVQHVIEIQFDNTHFSRDNSSVLSDLEQMPHLLNFITQNGSLLTNHHTPLISHTATDILTTLTGVYGDRMGVPVANSFHYFTPSGGIRTGVSFAYWTAPLFDPAASATNPATDTTPEMVDQSGVTSPAPWVPFTRAGCDFGSVATANTILENTAIDIPTVFGAGSPEAAEVLANPGQAFADFVGIGVHCAHGSAICSAANHGRQDSLPHEPGGYTGFNGLFGAKYVDPVIKPSGPMTDLNGNVIQDANGHVGFPGFDGMEATVSLSWVAQMQEAGIPVTYAYISDAHDGHGTAGNIHFAYGPGEAGYVQQLHDYDVAFGQFFDRLARDGINQSNTLFVFTADEGDHFAGDPPSNPGCDGVTVACTYNRVGEINADLRRMIRTEFGDTTAFSVHSDDAPNVYIGGNPAQNASVTRNLEREMGQLHWLNPYTGQDENNVMVALADQAEQKILHMMSPDLARNPTFTPFADPNWFFFATNGGSCATPADCASIPARSNQSFAWNHGDIQSEIVTTWLGMVGPGVKNLGVDNSVWTDHTDVRPTLMSLVGLRDDYSHQGRVIAEAVAGSALQPALRQHLSAVEQLGQAYKQLNASVGQFGMSTLIASTAALKSGGGSDDSHYVDVENQLSNLGSQRDSLVEQIESALEGAEFGGVPISQQQAQSLAAQAQSLIHQAQELAASS